MSEPDIPSENMSPEAIAEAEAESPAFPWGQAVQGGLTKRELFAAMAMQGAMRELAILAEDFEEGEVVDPNPIARDAVRMADALLKELAK